MKSKNIGIVYIFGSVYYIFAEVICALFFKDSLLNTYLFHTISELGIPSNNSPFFQLMNSAFILIGLTLILGNFSKFKEYIIKNNVLYYLLTVVTSLGVIIVGLIHGGNPITSGYHTLGAVMAILGGNILLIIISKSMKKNVKYQNFTLLLGIIGFIAFWILFFNMTNIYMPVFERLSVYILILWNFITGVLLFKQKL